MDGSRAYICERPLLEFNFSKFQSTLEHEYMHNISRWTNPNNPGRISPSANARLRSLWDAATNGKRMIQRAVKIEHATRKVFSEKEMHRLDREVRIGRGKGCFRLCSSWPHLNMFEETCECLSLSHMESITKPELA